MGFEPTTSSLGIWSSRSDSGLPWKLSPVQLIVCHGPQAGNNWERELREGVHELPQFELLPRGTFLDLP